MRINLAKIRFRTGGKLFDFDTQDLILRRTEKVVADTEDGVAIGEVVVFYPDLDFNEKTEPRKILRRVTSEDMERENRLREKEEYAKHYCEQKISEQKLSMKMVCVEFQPNGAKAVFYFTADGRIDFRELVKDLAKEFHTRIQMRQIGVRDEAKMLGGVGRCGKELCCTTFLKDFIPVTIKAAKDQQLPLNPVKVSGVCGRLLCCLAYEHDIYIEYSKGLPRVGMKVLFKDKVFTIRSLNVLKKELTLYSDEEHLYEIANADEVKRLGRVELESLTSKDSNEPKENSPKQLEPKKSPPPQKTDSNESNQNMLTEKQDKTSRRRRRSPSKNHSSRANKPPQPNSDK